MRMVIALIGALGFMAGVASAADLPLKAPLAPRAPIFYGGSGTYCGAGAGGEATKVAGAVGAATYEAGGLMNFNCGYAFAVGADRFMAVQANYAFSNTDAKPECLVGQVCSVNHHQSADLKVMYGAPLSVLTGLFSNAASAFPALPPAPIGVVNTSMHPYISGGVRVEQDTAAFSTFGVNTIVEQKKTKVKGLLGVGAIYQTNSNTTVNTFADWTFGSGRFLLQPGTEIKVGSTFRFGVIVNYGLGG